MKNTRFLLFQGPAPELSYFLLLPATFVNPPFLMHFAQTKARTVFPLTNSRIFCRFGLKLRFDQRLILLPVPPCFLGIPFRTTFLPVRAFLPQIAHCFNMSRSVVTPGRFRVQVFKQLKI